MQSWESDLQKRSFSWTSSYKFEPLVDFWFQNPDKQKGTPKFTGTALPETITCIKDQPCTLPLRVTDPQGTK